ncbi:MAG: hypothetical protein IKR17_01095 [Bacteroidales bacterium]|nr:hypothetical protein [Bacteroidales bacterium]
MKLISKTIEKGMTGLYSGHGEIIKAFDGSYSFVKGDIKFESINSNVDYVLQPIDKSIVKVENGILYLYWNGEFQKMSYMNIDDSIVVYNNNYYVTYCRANDIIKVLCVDKDDEYLFDIPSNDSFRCKKLVSKVIVFGDVSDKALLFYTKTGQRLWEYKEEDENLKINGRCIPVVDDVVVVISEDCAVAEKIQGFNIHTGKKLWEISNAEEIVCPNTFFVGEDQYLYGCCTECAYYDEESKLIMTKLNPKNGNTESIDVGMGFSAMSYDVTMHDRQLYYIDNRPGNEIGVIDVDKKELIERVPLNIKKKVTIGAPVVTDDKVYVFIRDLQELRVFQK